MNANFFSNQEKKNFFNDEIRHENSEKVNKFGIYNRTLFRNRGKVIA